MSLVTQRRSPARLLVKLQGVLDAELGAELCASLERELAGVREVLFDLRWLSGHDDAGRAALLRAHAKIQGAAIRSAYVTVHPRVRSLVFQLCQETQDPHVRPVPSEVMAEAWFSAPDQIRFAEQSFEAADRLLTSTGRKPT